MKRQRDPLWRLSYRDKKREEYAKRIAAWPSFFSTGREAEEGNGVQLGANDDPPKERERAGGDTKI